jgi:hypothetical protein
MLSTLINALLIVLFMVLIYGTYQLMRIRAAARPFKRLLAIHARGEPVPSGSAPKIGAREQMKRDGELIAFARLYEMTRVKRSIQLAIFAEQVSDYFPAIKNELNQFSQMLTTHGAQAYGWFESRFPAKHAFIRRVVVFLQTAESLPDPTEYLRQNAELLERLSADLYKQKKDFQAPIVNALISVPTMLIFLMVILILLNYMTVVQQSIQFS